MTDTKPIRRIAIIGTGVIGASWSSLFLAKGLQVVATDPAPTAEAALRKFVETAWPALKRLGLSPGASQSNLKFTASLAQAVADADLVEAQDQRNPVRRRVPSGALRHRPSVQSAALDSARRDRRRRQDFRRDDPTRSGILHV